MLYDTVDTSFWSVQARNLSNWAALSVWTGNDCTVILCISNQCPIKPDYGPAVAQAVSRWLPNAATPVRVRTGIWGLWWTKLHWGRFSPKTSVYPANHSTNFSIIIITRGGHNRPIGGRSAESTQLDSVSPYTNLKHQLINWYKYTDTRCSQ
jgi:hypothetical protein